jgi:hypothetical protein
MSEAFVWPSHEARAQNPELNRVCAHLERVLEAASTQAKLLDKQAVLSEFRDVIEGYGSQGWPDDVHADDVLEGRLSSILEKAPTQSALTPGVFIPSDRYKVPDLKPDQVVVCLVDGEQQLLQFCQAEDGEYWWRDSDCRLADPSHYSLWSIPFPDAVFQGRLSDRQPASAEVDASNAEEGDPVAYADPQAFTNFSNGTATKEWMWAKPDTGLVPLVLMHGAAPKALPKTARQLIADVVGYDRADMLIFKLENQLGIYEDIYEQIVEMIEPQVQREWINPNGEFPASVVGTVQLLLEHYRKSEDRSVQE